MNTAKTFRRAIIRVVVSSAAALLAVSFVGDGLVLAKSLTEVVRDCSTGVE